MQTANRPGPPDRRNRTRIKHHVVPSGAVLIKFKTRVKVMVAIGEVLASLQRCIDMQ